MNIPIDPKLQKELAEERQREILEEVEKVVGKFG